MGSRGVDESAWRRGGERGSRAPRQGSREKEVPPGRHHALGQPRGPSTDPLVWLSGGHQPWAGPCFTPLPSLGLSAGAQDRLPSTPARTLGTLPELASGPQLLTLQEGPSSACVPKVPCQP